MRSLEVALEEKEIVLGGCNVTSHDPKWECTDCGTRYKTSRKIFQSYETWQFLLLREPYQVHNS